MERVSKHISYKEATSSYTAKKMHIDNTPNRLQMNAMMLVAKKIFEPIREYFNVPIYIPSFFRSEALNNILGGAENSQHTKGEAIDIDADSYGEVTNKEIFEYILDNLEFDQLIWELGDDKNPGWVHVSLKQNNNRKQVLKAVKCNTKNNKYTVKYINYEK